MRGDAVAGEKAVADAGGRTTRHLPLINGLAASVPAQGITTLATAGGVRAITLDRQVNVQSGSGSGASNPVYGKVVRADDTWAQGVTGSGVTVALLDTGIADVADL